MASKARFFIALALLWLAPQAAHAATYSYVDWTQADVTAGTAKGTITLPDSSTVTVTFEAVNSDGTPGNLYGAQVSGGTNYWSPSEPYVSPAVENFPPTTDILQLSGGQNQTYKVTLSEAIKDPLMAVVSLGAPGTTITYDFDAPFTIVSQGPGYWGGGNAAMQQLPGDILQGTEAHGTVQFLGSFATFSWTVPTPETWHGFTFGIRTTERLEPTDAGADARKEDAGGFADAAAPDARPLFDGGDASGDAFGSGMGNGSDAGRRRTEDDGCSCRIGRKPGNNGSEGGAAVAGLVLAALCWRRKRR